MISTEKILTVARKELKGYFDNPTAYIVLVVFLLLWEFLFFRNAFIVGEASLRGLFDLLPWLSLLLVPALTMGSIAQEKSDGTLELLLTHPLRDLEILLGKFFATIGFVGLALLAVSPIALSFNSFGNLDWGIVLGQYLAGLLLAGVLASLGIFVSSLFSSQISALLVAAAASFFLVIAGFEVVTSSLPLPAAAVFERLSVLSHFDSMARGVIDLRDVWYLLSAIAVFLSLAYLQLLRRRFGNRKNLYRRYQAGMALFVGIAILTNIVGSRIPGRLDLTEGNLYTLAAETRQVLGEVPDVVSLTLYASDQLPAQLQPTLRDVKDTLRDYDTMGGGNVAVTTVNPDADPQIAQEAQSRGIQPVQFNVVGQQELQVKSGYLGVAVAYGGATETIPFVQGTDDLEYQLTTAIKQLTTTDKKTVVFLTGHGEKSQFTVSTFTEGLGKQFEVEDLATGEGEEFSVGEDVNVVIVAGPVQELDEQTRQELIRFVEGGGGLLALVDGMTVSPQVGSATPVQTNVNELLKAFGVTVEQNLVYDVRSNEVVSFGGGPFGLAVQYPFWPRVVAKQEHTEITEDLESVALPWPSSLTVNEKVAADKGLTITTLLTTTQFGGKQTGSISIDPTQEVSRENLGAQTVAVSIDGTEHSGRLVVVGDSDFVLDQFAQDVPENTALALAAVSWLAGEESLSGIQLRQQGERRLMFTDATQVGLVKYGNMVLALVVPLGLGFIRLSRRRNLRGQTYHASSKREHHE